MKWTDVLKILGPAILAVVPGGPAFIPLIMAGMEIAEESQKSGAEKRKIGKDVVVLGAQTANTIAKSEVVNTEEAAQVYDDSVDAIVGAVKLVKKVTDKEDTK